VKILSIGLAGENKVRFATVITDDGSTGSSGFGAVMGSKNLKAIAVNGTGTLIPAKPERLQETREYLRRLTRDRTITPPNFALPQKRSACYGCITGCLRTVSGAGDNTKSMCQAAGMSGPPWDIIGPTEVPASANRLCNSYGLNTMVIDNYYLAAEISNKFNHHEVRVFPYRSCSLNLSKP
jgi:aldehyde:ferredoxin oxidoreductase